jgi:hypothetical protein
MRLLRSARLLVFALLMSVFPASSHAQIAISVNFAPPALPVYEQPICPQANLMWTPGNWAYDSDYGDYYWVPGAWVPAPYVGALWTPSYWGWNNGNYAFNQGYWGPEVGYYGGVDYGGGYLGIGFAGGMWQGGVFAYNTAVVNVNTTVIHNTYVNRTIIETNTVSNPNHVAYSGGPGGVRHEPTAREQAAMHQHHTPPTRYQTAHVAAARADKASFAKANGGHPRTLAIAKPLPAARVTPPAGVKTAARAPAPASRTAPRTEARTTAKPATRSATTTARTESRTTAKP